MNVGPYTLFPHQERTVAATRAALAGLVAAGEPPRVLVQGPCGVGKTIISSAIIAAALGKGKKVGFLANRRQLIFQKSNKLRECGIPHSKLMNGEPYHFSLVTVASKDTLWSRAFENQRIAPITPDIWIIDEAHEGMSAAYQQIVGDSIVIGLSATPALGNGKGLGAFYKRLVISATHAELLEGGFLCPPRVFAPYIPDLSGLGRPGANGDWSQVKVERQMDQMQLVGDVVDYWKKFGGDRPTACFASGVGHSIHLADEFNRNGIPAAHVDAETPQEDRERVYSDIESGRLKVVTNYGILTTGFDLPCLGCGILAFATSSVTKYLQVCGRMLRTHATKDDAIILDHGGNVHRHGWPTEDREWNLNPDEALQAKDWERREREGKPREPICCPKCGAMREGGPQCFNCGHKHVRSGLKVKMANGVLKEMTPAKVKKKKEFDDQRTWNKCLAIAANRNFNFKQASMFFHKMKGRWPGNDLQYMPAEHHRSRKVAVVFPGFVRKRVT